MTTTQASDRRPAGAPDAIGLSCMEIWGGNKPISQAISVPGIDAYVHALPYRDSESGGDIHYLSLCGAGNISRYVVADVSGHGRVVNEITTRLRRLMRKHINTADQSSFARALNEEFSRIARGGQFATAIMMTYFAPSDELIICNAGHPRPLWYRARRDQWLLLDDSSARELASEPRDRTLSDLPLGVIEPTEYHQFIVPLEPGDIVLAYTDSLIEATDPDGTPLGESGLRELVRSLGHADAHRLHDDVLERVSQHTSGAIPNDDQTLMVLYHNASNPPKQSLGNRIRMLGRMMGLTG